MAARHNWTSVKWLAVVAGGLLLIGAVGSIFVAVVVECSGGSVILHGGALRIDGGLSLFPGAPEEISFHVLTHPTALLQPRWLKTVPYLSCTVSGNDPLAR